MLTMLTILVLVDLSINQQKIAYPRPFLWPEAASAILEDVQNKHELVALKTPMPPRAQLHVCLLGGMLNVIEV